MRRMLLCDLVVIRRQLPQIALIGLLCALILSIVSVLMAAVAVIMMATLMITYMVVVTLSAYDDVSGWAAFRLALPLSRRDVVLGRYATVAVTCLASAVFGIALSALVGPVEAAVLPLVTGETLATGWNLSDALALAVAGISLSITYMAVILPIYLTFGTTKGTRLLAVFLIIVPAAMIGASDGIISGIPEQFTTGAVVLTVLPAIALVLFAISATIAMRLYARRDL